MISTTMRAQVSELLALKKHMPGALLVLLHDIQDLAGYIPAELVGDIAAALNLSRAEVHGFITFYHHFRSVPPSATVVQVCRAEACQSMGAQKLWDHAVSCAATANGKHGDAAVSVEPVYCLGLCSTAPAVQINSALHARVQIEQVEGLLTHALTQQGAAA